MERPFGEHAIASLTQTPNRPLFAPKRTPERPRWSPNGASMDPRQTPVTLNSLYKWALQCLFTFWNITILDCNSNYLALYSILFFDTNVYNES